MSRYIIKELDSIQQRASKFKFTCCAVYGDLIAFGTSTGSIHLFSISNQRFSSIISESQISTSLKSLDFSPSGNYLLVCEENKISIIEHPENKPSILTKYDLGSNVFEDSCWLSDPPSVLDRNSCFLYIGDRQGTIYAITRTSCLSVATVNSPIFQISLVDKTLLINSINGVYFMSSNFEISPIRSKRPNGKFGGIYVEENFNAICFSRPDGKLFLATQQGKVRAQLPVFENGKPSDIPEKIDINLSYLTFCYPFLISTGQNSATIIIDLNQGKLLKYFATESLFLDISSQGGKTVIMWQDKVILLTSYRTDEEYISDLLKINNYLEIQRVCIESKIDDIEKLESYIDPNLPIENQKTFTDYIARVKQLHEPGPLKETYPELYSKIMESDIPSKETVDELKSVLKSVKVDDDLQSRIEKYILKYPSQWEYWKSIINVDRLIPILNESSETAKFAMAMSPFGVSQYASLLSRVDGLPVNILVANSPPIREYNVNVMVRDEYIARMALIDQFSSYANNEIMTRSISSEKLLQDIKLTDSPTNDLIDEIGETDDPAKIMRIMSVNDWEEDLVNSVEELHQLAEKYFLTKESKPLPAWASDAKKNHLCEGCGNWGVTSELQECQICGMSLKLESAVVSAFPCGHIFHAKCLHTRYCPLCYSVILK